MAQKTGMAWLRLRMEQLGYSTLEQVASDLGINRGNLYRYFSLQTRPSVALLPKFCKVFRTDADTMLRALGVLKGSQKV